MKKGQVYEGIVEETLFPNKGIVNIKDNDDIIKKDGTIYSCINR